MQLTRRATIALLASAAPFAARAAKSNDTLTAAFPREVRTLDGNYANLRENDILGLLVDDALFAVDPKSGQPVPCAAKEATYRDATTLVVTLRDDVHFHDGGTMTADDVVYTFTYILDAANQNDYQSRFVRWLAGVTAEGANTVVFKLKQPYAMALYDFAMYAKIRRKDSYADASKPGGFNAEAQTLKLNGTGPYRVLAFRPGQQLVLQRFDRYRAESPKGKPAIRNITIRIIPDYATQAAEVISGGVDWTFGMPADLAENTARSGLVQNLAGPSLRTHYISLDAEGKTLKDGPLTKRAVRQALNLAINKDAIVKNLIRGAGEVLDTPCIPAQFGCSTDGITRYAFDPSKAKALIVEAGYPDGFELELWSATHRPVCEAIVGFWKAVGVKATLRVVQGPTLTQSRRENKIAAEFASSGSFGIPDAGAILPDRLGPGSQRNFSGDKAMSDLVLKAVSTVNQDERKAHFAAANRIITAEAYWVPLFTDGQNFVMAKDLAYEQAADGMQRLFLARWR
ncbi:MAG: ABC transporter substrate-binding protein [Beijerinckiaceae bacterium]